METTRKPLVQILLLLGMLTCAALSIHQVAESVHRTLDWPYLTSYGSAIALLALISVGLALVRNSAGIVMFGGILALVVSWVITLLCNAHSIFYSSAHDELTNRDLSLLESRMLELRVTGVDYYDKKAQALRNGVNDLNRILGIQILDEMNQGVGPRADSVITSIEALLGTKITPQMDPNIESLAAKMQAQVKSILDEKLLDIDESRTRFMNHLNEVQYDTLLKKLQYCNANRFSEERISAAAVNQLLLLASQQYNHSLSALAKVDSSTYAVATKKGLVPVPNPPRSVEVAKFTDFIKYVFNPDAYTRSELVVAFVFGFVLDFGFLVLQFFLFSHGEEVSFRRSKPIPD